MTALAMAASTDATSRRRVLGGSAPLSADLLSDLLEALQIIGHDGTRVHAEVAMTFDLHDRLAEWWQQQCAPPPALSLAV
ncbi:MULTISPECIES: hypothetical protein [unclassified Chelatococcus]|uniref:hypothetical protein n=1 Tax=unclassified Chelatococcus TaxID=2638111 RepID=UPI001BCB0F87|nr:MULTISPECIES: hypothetical protein [unclassified Chelatococcus]MBS7697561.1 hypothetical protein [Chelatococcus sp. YT9]MBX3559364.1 hypothetical protein [Chelatococcus sp.]